MSFPKADRQYVLITDAATGTAETPGGLGAILTQVDKDRILCNLVCIQATKGPRKELLVVLTGSRGCRVGHGLLK